VPSCDEAIDAAVLVLAVALAEATAVPPEPNGRAAEVRAPENAFTLPTAPRLANERAAPSSGPSKKHPRAAVVALGGVDVNTLPQATAYLGGAVALLSLPMELRAAFRYGLGREEENQETNASERTRAEFGALELSACHGFDSDRDLSLCAGGELGVVHLERVRSEGEESVDVDESEPRVAGVLTGRLAQSVGPVRLELELGGSLVAVGPDGARRASLRLGAGAGTRF
jgi:hypothetical protein